MFDKCRFWFLGLVYDPVFSWVLSSSFLLCINLKCVQEGDSNQEKQPCILKVGNPKTCFAASPRDAIFIKMTIFFNADKH